MEHNTLLQNEWLRLLRSILLQSFTYYHLNSEKGSFGNFPKLTYRELKLRQTGCGKTTFVQNLARNKKFRELKSVDWI